MPKPPPTENPLTAVLKLAEELVREQEVELMAQFGIPLYVTERGVRARETNAMPASFDGISPEELQVLIEVHGEDAVTEAMVAALRRQSEEEE